MILALTGNDLDTLSSQLMMLFQSLYISARSRTYLWLGAADRESLADGVTMQEIGYALGGKGRFVNPVPARITPSPQSASVASSLGIFPSPDQIDCLGID